MQSVNKKEKLRYIHVAIIFAFIFGFRFLPPIGPISPLGMQTIGVFLAVVYGWSTMDMLWPSLLGLFGLSLLPGRNAIEVFQEGFGDRITVALFFFLLFGELLSRVGLSKFIADWCVTRKFAQGKPYAILGMFCLAGGIISAFVNCFAGIILIWGVFYSFCKDAGIKPGSSFGRIGLVTLIYVTLMAGNILPFMGSSILISGLQEKLTGIPVNYITFALLQLIMVLVATAIYFLIVIFVFRPDTSVVKAYKPSCGTLKMNSQQKLCFGLLIGMLVALFLPGILPKSWMLTQIIKTLDISGVLAVVFVIYYVVNLNNPQVVEFKEITRNVNWSVIFMFATVTPIASAVANPDAGIMQYINQVLTGFLGEMNPLVFTVLILFLASILTQFCNNVAVMLLTIPIMYTFAVQLGANPIVLTILAAFNLNIAFCTPAASGPAAMMFSNKEWIGVKYSYIHGLVIFAVNMIATVIGMYLAELFI